ncbi:hypothetical protein [Amorphus sp. MBR-141]
MTIFRTFLAVSTILVLQLSAAASEPLKVEAIMAPKEKIQLDFNDGSKHFLLMVRREGEAKGTGLLNGTKVVEYGMHDIVPGVGGDPRGYLVMTAPNGDIAYVKWQVRAVFVPGPDGKPQLLDNGFWELTSGTGAFSGATGAGILHIKAVSPTDRKFILDGDIFTKK